MNLIYVKTRFGNKVRINKDDLDNNKPLIRMYNQYGKKLDDHYRKPNEAKSIHIDNIVSL